MKKASHGGSHLGGGALSLSSPSLLSGEEASHGFYPVVYVALPLFFTFSLFLYL